MTAIPIPPGVGPGQCPPFHALMDEIQFQDMCRDLLAREQGIATCTIYGRRGQRQHGIDIKAAIDGDVGLALGQCKRYQSFGVRDIERASDEFLEHWDGHWQHRGIRKFIVFVGCAVDDPSAQDEIDTQRERFRGLGIVYELWCAATIMAKLANHREIATRYLPTSQSWVEVVCGSAPMPLDTNRGNSAAMLALAATTDMLASRASSHIEQELDLAREAWREGRLPDSTTWIRRIRDDNQVWPLLDTATRAKIICFEASLALEIDNDIARASELLTESETLTRTPNAVRLRAFIEYKLHGRDSAITLLESCDDAGCRNMKAALLIELDRASEALQLLESDYDNVTRVLSVETHRLRAIALLILGRTDEAIAQINEALQLAPTWRDIQFCAAQIEYFCTLTETCELDRRPTWPDPVEPALVKRDQQSVNLLRRAQDRLRNLWASAHGGQECDEVNAWLLACLAVDTDKQTEAVDQCRSMLDQNPANFVAIAWAIQYGWDVDLSRCEGPLLALIDNGDARPPHIAALLDYFLHNRRTANALELLERASSLLGDGADDPSPLMLIVWRTQALAADGRYAEALSALDGADEHPVLSDVRTSILRAEAVASGNWDRLVEHLQSLVEHQGEPHSVLQFCQLMAYLQRWQEVSLLADRLVEAMPTPPAIELAATGLANTGEFSRSLEMLEHHSPSFPNGSLSAQARRIRARCLHSMGRQIEAKAEMERLVSMEDAPIGDLLFLAQIYSETLDIRQLAILAHRLVEHNDLPARDALMIAGLLKRDELRLSQLLWHKSVQTGVPDELTGMAIGLGFELGLDHEVAPLFERALQIGDETHGGLRTVNFSEITDLFAEDRRQAEELFERYQRGELPIHIIAAQRNLSLTQLYHSMLADNETAPNPLVQPVLYARHGGRIGGEEVLPDPVTWRLHADITALLLSEHIGLLTLVEEHFSPILIPEQVVPALYQMRDRAQPHQPSQLAAMQLIDRLVTTGHLHLVEQPGAAVTVGEEESPCLGCDLAAHLSLARMHHGLAVEFLPLRDNMGDPIATPLDIEHIVVGSRALVDALLAHGYITQNEHQSIITRFGTEATVRGGTAVVEDGMPLFAGIEVAKLLASSGALAALCRCYPVHIIREEHETLRRELVHYSQREELERWVVTLMERVRNGLDRGIYVITTRPEAPNDEGQESLELSPDVGCLTTIIGSEASTEAVLWVDDRWANGARCSRPVVDVTDVLRALFTTGAITSNQHYAMLHRLRAGNVRFMPLLADEIVHYICDSQIQNETLIPSRQLSVFTRYLAATLARCQDDLRFAPIAPDQQAPELAYLMSVPRVLKDVLVKLWLQCAAHEDDRNIRMEWFRRHLYVDHASLAALMAIERGDEAKRHAVGLALGSLFMHGLTWNMDRAGEWRRQRRLFNEWADERLLVPAVEADTTVLSLAAGAIAVILKQTIEHPTAGIPHRLARGIAAMFFDDLPVRLKEELTQDNQLMSLIGASCFSTVTIDGFTFDADSYWHAVKQALDSHTSTVTPLNADGTFTLEPARNTDGAIAVPILHPGGIRRGMIRIPAPGLFADDPTVREHALQDLPAWFDGDAIYREQAISSISASNDVSYRMYEAEKCRRSSMAVYYAELSQKEAVGIDDVRAPSANSVLRHLRLHEQVGSECTFTEALDTAAGSLLADIGVYGAIERLIGLPVVLPAVLVDAASSLDTEERRQLIRSLLGRADSPIARMHIIHLLWIWSNDSPAYKRLAHRIVRHLLSDTGQQEVETFRAVIGKVCSDFACWPEMRSWCTPARLAVIWSHAHRIYARFSTGRSDPQYLGAWMHQFDQTGLASMLTTWSPEYWHDAAHPHRLCYTKLMVNGLAYACGNEGAHWLGDDILAFLQTIAVTQTESGPFISASLLTDTFQATDSMGSLLGGDPGDALRSLFGEDVAALGSHAMLREHAQNATNILQANWNDPLAWAILAGVLGDFAPYDEITGALTEVISNIDLTALSQDNYQATAYMLRFAAGIAYHVGDEDVRGHIREQLLVATRLYSAESHSAGDTQNRQAAMLRACKWLLEAALCLAIAEGEPQEIAATLTSVVHEISDVWSLVAKAVLPTIHDCCGTLPATVANPFWPLLVRLRAVYY